MKIAVWHNLPSGGGKRALHDHVRGLLARGHTVEAWCPPTADQNYLPLGNLIQEHIVPYRWKPPIAFEPLTRTLALRDTVVSQILAMDEHCKACAEQINTRGFDLLLAHPCMSFRVTAIGRFVNLPKVIYLQEPYRWLYEAMPQLPWLAKERSHKSAWSLRGIKNSLNDLMLVQGKRIQVREELRNAKEFQTILVNSYFSRESVLRAYGLDSKVCYLGIDTELFRRQEIPKEDYVIGIGAIVPEKNIDFVIRSVAMLPHPRPRLIWVGNVSLPLFAASLQQLAQTHNVCFEMVTAISDENLVRLLNQAVMMVYAPRLEPFGYAPLEANACGTPVVAVAEGGVRETISNGIGGLLVDHDPKAMAQCIQRLLNDSDYTLHLANQGAVNIEKCWSLDASIDRLEARLEEVLAGKCGDQK